MFGWTLRVILFLIVLRLVLRFVHGLFQGLASGSGGGSGSSRGGRAPGRDEHQEEQEPVEEIGLEAGPEAGVADLALELRGVGLTARRAVGTSVVLVDGRPILFVESGGRQVLCFDGVTGSETENEAALLAAMRELAANVRRLGARRLAILRIDGEPALRSERAPVFLRAGFRASDRGLELDRLLLG